LYAGPVAVVLSGICPGYLENGLHLSDRSDLYRRGRVMFEVVCSSVEARA
jgi:hypothetical protein